jgi:hypothetical protein
VTIGPRGLENSIVELTARADGERHDVPVDDVVARLVDLVVTGRSAGR